LGSRWPHEQTVEFAQQVSKPVAATHPNNEVMEFANCAFPHPQLMLSLSKLLGFEISLECFAAFAKENGFGDEIHDMQCEK
jgi:hypothetical protein